jgi:hypothetical protein
MITACKKEPENRVALKSPLSKDITFLQWVSAVLVSRCSDSPQGLYCTFCELQQPSTRSTLGNYFRVLIETHIFYFAAWAHDLNDIVLSHWTFSRTRYTNVAWTSVVSPNIGVCYPWLTSTFNHSSSFYKIHLPWGVYMFISGPRLILSVREYHQRHVSELETDMSTITF